MTRRTRANAGVTNRHTGKKQPGTHGRGKANLQADAMRLLCDGWQLAAVARQLGVNRNTVRDWRDSPDGQRLLAEARVARESHFVDAAERARAMLRESAVAAVQALRDDLASPGRRSRAARAILDRIGVMGGQTLHVTSGVIDLSQLPEDVLAALEAARTTADKAVDAATAPAPKESAT